MPGQLQPLAQNFKIVDENGFPNQYFIKWAQQRQEDISDAMTLADLQAYLTAHKLREGSGIQFTPDGDINNDPLIAADVQEILDQITSTRGAILYRGLLGWAALNPGTVGQFLQTAGAGADPLWAAGGGGGGGSGGYEAGPEGTIPNLGTWTGWNLGTSTLVSTAKNHIFTPQNGGVMRGYYTAIPAFPFDIYMRMNAFQLNSTLAQQHNGILLRANATGNTVMLVLDEVGGSPNAQISRWSSAGGFVTTTVSISPWKPTAVVWLRANVTSTTITYYVSTDGFTWQNIGTETIATYLGTLTHYGFGNYQASQAGGSIIGYLSTTAPA
jgi:hypothetical protein